MKPELHKAVESDAKEALSEKPTDELMQQLLGDLVWNIKQLVTCVSLKGCPLKIRVLCRIFVNVGSYISERFGVLDIVCWPRCIRRSYKIQINSD